MRTTRTLRATSVLLLALLAALPAQATIEGDFPEVVLFATNSMVIESSVQVFTGDVVVNEAVAGTLSFGNKAKTPAGWEVKAYTINVGNNVTLAGTEFCNSGNYSPCSFLGTPVYDNLPIFQTSSPGAVDIDIPNSMSADLTGNARDITIGLEGTLNISTGVHNVRSITASKKAELVFTGLGPWELRIEQGLSMGVEANINLSGAAASQVILYVGGDATLGPKSEVNANVYLETGTLVISGNVIATGAFLAEDLIVETKAKINLATFFDSPPEANDDVYSVNEDDQLSDSTAGPLGNGVLANDTDAENDLLVAILVTDVLKGDLTLNSDGSFTYDPDDDYYGADSFTYMACDEMPYNVDNCDTALVSITVDPINDVPEFTAGADPVVSNEDAGLQSLAWASAISPGAPGLANETDQVVSFNVTNDNNGLFSSQPAIDSSGTLTYTSAADANGSATVTVSLSDDCPAPPLSCGVSGPLTSADQTFTITVNAVNDEPSFAKGPDQGASEDDPMQSVAGWATDISPGPANESTQMVSFVVTNTNNGLFSEQPAVDAAGTLTYTPAPDAFGSASVSVSAMDDGGTANGGDDTSDPQIFAINITSVNDPPVAENDEASTPEETQVTVDLVANDSAGPANELDTLTLQPLGGTDILEAEIVNNQLVYTPPVDFFGDREFNYSVCDSGDGAQDPTVLCDSATAIITVTPVNDAPTANPQDLFATATVEILLTASDPDGDSLTFTEFTGPTKGTLGAITPIVPPGGGPVISATVEYTPDSQLCGGDPLECPEDFFTFQVSDGSLFDTADVTLNPGGDPTDDPPALGEVVANDQVCESVEVEPGVFEDQCDLEVVEGTMITIILTAAAPCDETGATDPDLPCDGLPTVADDVPLTFTAPLMTTQGGTLTPVDQGTGELQEPPGADEVPQRTAWVVYTPPASPFTGIDSFTFVVEGDVDKSGGIGGLAETDTGTIEISVAAFTPPPPVVARDQSVTTEPETPVEIFLSGPAGECDPLDPDCRTGPLGPVSGSAATAAPSSPSSEGGSNNGARPSSSLGPVSADPTSPFAPLTEGVWESFTWFGTIPVFATDIPTGDSEYTFSGAGCVSVADSFLKGDQFRIYDNLVALGETTPVAKVGSGLGTDDEDASYLDPTYSSGIFAVGDGPHSITVEVIGNSFDSGDGFIRFDTTGSGLCTNAPNPNLTITQFSAPATAEIDQALGTSISVTVANTGNVATAAAGFIGLYISDDAVITTGDTLLIGGREALPALSPGGSAVIILVGSNRIPIDAPSGDVFIGALVDEFDVVAEISETDNTASQAITIEFDPGTPAPTAATFTVTSLPLDSFGQSAGTLTYRTEEGVMTVIASSLPLALPSESLTFTPAVGFIGTTSFAFEVADEFTFDAGQIDIAIVIGAIVDQCVVVGRDPGCTPGAAPVSSQEPITGLPSGAAFTVSVSGPGDITSSRPMLDGESYLGLVCNSGSACSANFVEGSTVVLYARPVEAGSEFVEWGGDCYGTDPVTLVRAGTDTLCTATFQKTEE